MTATCPTDFSFIFQNERIFQNVQQSWTGGRTRLAVKARDLVTREACVQRQNFLVKQIVLLFMPHVHLLDILRTAGSRDSQYNQVWFFVEILQHQNQNQNQKLLHRHQASAGA